MAVLAGQQPEALREAVVIEDGLDALLPLAALSDEGVAQADLGAQIEQVVGRNPRLGQPADHHQLAQVAGVGAVGLGALLGAAPRGRFGRLGAVHLRPDRAQLLDDEAPPGRGLQRRLESPAGELGQEPADVGALGGRDTGPTDLAGLGVDPLGRDLRTVLIESHYDRHHGASSSSTVHYLRASCALELRRSHYAGTTTRHMPSLREVRHGRIHAGCAVA